MDFGLSEDQQMLEQTVRAFLGERVPIERVRELRERDCPNDRAIWQALAELGITGVLTTEVSAHCRSVVREVDHARRVMYAAREDNMPPRHIDESLLALHERRPFVYSSSEVADLARAVKDDNFRIQVNADGIHVYNRHGLRHGTDAYELYPQLGVDDDAPHAFYLGLELARAEIAWQLGKRYDQDEPLGWGVVRPRPRDDKRHFAAERSTLKARRAQRRKRRESD